MPRHSAHSSNGSEESEEYKREFPGALPSSTVGRLDLRVEGLVRRGAEFGAASPPLVQWLPTH